MDLISRDKALADDGLLEFHRYDDYSKMRKYLKSIPSAFEGMTNGEVIKALFPEIDTHDFGITVHATERVTCCGDKHCRGSISYDFWKEWWNAPYKRGGE